MRVAGSIPITRDGAFRFSCAGLEDHLSIDYRGKAPSRQVTMTTYRNAMLKLLSRSAPGGTPKMFAGQTVQILNPGDAAPIASEGNISGTHHRLLLRWSGRSATDLIGMTDVRGEENGAVLAEGSIDAAFGAVWNLPDDVQFLIT